MYAPEKWQFYEKRNIKYMISQFKTEAEWGYYADAIRASCTAHNQQE